MSDEKTLRDTFAAAALTGLLAAPTDKDRSWEYWARLSYEAADAMLQERKGVTESKPAASAGIGSVTPVPYAKHDEKRVDWHTAGGTNHDAVPEAKAMHTRDCSGVLSGTGNTPEPVAWAVAGVGYEYVSLLRESAAEAARSGGGVMVPLYRRPQPTLTDAEREAVEWYASYGKGNHADTLRGLLARLPETSTPPDSRR